MLAPRGPSRLVGSWTLSSLPGALGPTPSCVSGLWCAGVPSPGPCCLFGVRLCPFAAVLRVVSHAWPTARSEQLRQLAVQFASLASGRRGHARSASLLEAPWARCASLTRGACPACRAFAPSVALPCRSWASILLSHRGPTGLSVKSCPAVPPGRSVSSHRCASSLASAAGLVEPRSADGAARVSALSEPRSQCVCRPTS